MKKSIPFCKNDLLPEESLSSPSAGDEESILIPIAIVMFQNVPSS